MFTFALPGGILSPEPRMLTEAEQVYGDPLANLPDKFVWMASHERAGHVQRRGVMRSLAWLYLFKNFTLKDWVVFNERFAQPMRIGKFSPGASEADRRVLKQAVFNLGSDAAAIISESTMIELLESTGKTGSAAIYERLAAYCDRAVTKVILGHEGASNSTPGRLGGDTQAADVREDILQADAAALGDVFTALSRLLVGYNFGPDVAVPRVTFLVEDQGEDLQQLATTYKVLTDMGVKIPEAHIRERFGIPAARQGEE
jgi:phage gp29-like protein